MRKLLLTIAATLLTGVAALAVPAKPGVTRTVIQSDGTTLTLRLAGDEWNGGLVTTDGKPCGKALNGDYCYRTVNGLSDVIAHEPAQRTVSEQSFLTINEQNMTATSIAKQRKTRAAASRPRKAAGDTQVPQSGTIRVPILLVQYQDVSFTHTKAELEEVYCSTTGNSAYKYFYDQSNGKFKPQFELYGPVTLSQNRAYYGAHSGDDNDARPQAMVVEACQLLDSEVNFANYDNDGDGECDVVIVVYAGGGEAQTGIEEQIWPHQWAIWTSSYQYYKFDNTRVYAYAVFNELNGKTTNLDGVGTFCHEFGHVMGLPDFYETTYDNGYYGMGYWDIMCAGSYNNDGYTPVGYNAYEKEFMGWLTVPTMTANTKYTLPKWNAGNDVAYKVVSPLNSNECYYLENRAKQGWDAYIDDEGMLVTHLTYIAKRWTDNSPNDEAIQLFTVIPADNTLSTRNETTDCYGETNHELTDTSTPAAKLNMLASGSLASSTGAAGTMGQPLTEIQLNSDGTVSFYYMKGTVTKLDTPKLNDATDVTDDSFNISWGAVDNADSYTLQLTRSGNYTLLNEEDLTSGSPSAWIKAGGSSSTAGTSFNLGSSKNSGTLTSPALNFTGYDKATVVVNAAYYDSGSTLGVQVGNQTATISGLTSSFANYYAVVDISSETNLSSLKVVLSASNGKRVKLANVKVYAGDASSTLSSAPKRAVSTGGDASSTLTISGITATSYSVKDLVAHATYSVKVKAVTANTEEYEDSEWSAAKTVSLNKGPELIVEPETLALEAYVGETATKTFDILGSSLEGNVTVAVDGAMFSVNPTTVSVAEAEDGTTVTVTYAPTAVGTHTGTVTVSSDGATSVTVALTGTATNAPLTVYDPSLNDATDVTKNSFTASWTDATPAANVASYTLQVNKKAETPAVTTVSDVLTRAATGVTSGSSSYSAWTGKTVTSSAVYAGNSAGSNNAIQLRSSNSNSGIVSTTSGGKIRKVAVTWNSNTATDRTLNVYGSNTAYSAASQLYSTSTQGTKLGTIVCGTSTELTITGDYAYIGVCSNSGAMYLDDITFTWETSSASSAPKRASESGDADGEGLTVTGITAKQYTVTGLTAGATYEFKVKAVYTDDTESEYTTAKEVTLLEGDPEPSITTDVTSLDFGEIYTGATATQTLTVTGTALTDDIAVAVDGEEFSASVTSLGTDGGTLTVTYAPSTFGIHSGTLTLTSDGAEAVTVALTGTAKLEKGTLSLNDASDITAASFKASWTDATPAANVTGYTLLVNKKEVAPTPGYELLLSGDFTNGKPSTDWTNSNKGTSWNKNDGYFQLGASSNAGTLTTKELDFTGYDKATIVLNAANWNSSSTATITVTIDGATGTIKPTSATYADYTLVLDISSVSDLSAQSVEFTVPSGSRAKITSAKIYAGDASSAASAPKRAAESGDADGDGLTVTGITESEYTVTGLTAGATYEFKVKAVYADGTESEYTDAKEVTLEAGTPLADVLESTEGEYVISDILTVVATVGTTLYTTDGNGNWLPIDAGEQFDTFKNAAAINVVSGTFNGSKTAPVLTLVSAAESGDAADVEIANKWLGTDPATGKAGEWEMPVAGEVVNFYGYLFYEGGKAVLRGYSGKNGEKGRSLILLDEVDGNEGNLYVAQVGVQLAEAWSGAPRRVAASDDNAFQNLRGSVISIEERTATGIDGIDVDSNVVSVRYINAVGQVSDVPFDGINIVVTTRTDGTTTATKVLK